jgi:hypothetical protein
MHIACVLPVEVSQLPVDLDMMNHPGPRANPNKPRIDSKQASNTGLGFTVRKSLSKFKKPLYSCQFKSHRIKVAEFKSHSIVATGTALT